MRIATVILTAVLGLAAQAQAETQDFPYPETHKFWIPGWCGVHWHLRIDQKNLYGGQTFRHYVEKDNWWKMTVYDAHQAKRGEHEGHNLEVHALKTPPLPRDFHFWANPDDENNVVKFQYDNDVWQAGGPGTKNDRCSVGKWDKKTITAGQHYQYRIDLDCGFNC